MPEIKAGDSLEHRAPIVATRDHDVIQRWAEAHHAEPATGQETASGPATLDVNDTGAGIRFNFPGVGRYRPISWEEWFAHFDRHALCLVYDNDADSRIPSHRYRLVKADDWTDTIG